MRTIRSLVVVGLSAFSAVAADGGVSMKGSPDVSFRETAEVKKAERCALLGRQHGAKPIQRTMKALSESTQRSPAHIRILFYGQSIVGQRWHTLVLDELKRRYPTAVFEAENRAIGGFESPDLVRTAESDLYPYYADLVFFHVYGPMDRYEETVRKLRMTTTAEIVLWTSHLSRAECDAAAKVAKAAAGWDVRSRKIAEIAARYGCLFVDLRTKWARMMEEKGYRPDDLLADGIHLKTTGPGFSAYARFLSEELVRMDGEEGQSAFSGVVVKIRPDDRRVVRNADGSLTLTFEGNRVVAVSDGTGEGEFDLDLDARSVREHSEMFCTTRPSAIVSWMPMIRHVDVAPDSRPVAENWKLTYLEGTEPHGQPIRFKVEGSVSGFDGEGCNTNDFRSISGRVVISAADFKKAIWQYGYFIKPGKNEDKLARPGQWITWTTKALFADPYKSSSLPGSHIVLVQNCVNGKHRLTLRPRQGAKLGVSAFIVHRPAALCGSTKVRLE